MAKYTGYCRRTEFKQGNSKKDFDRKFRNQ